MNTVPVPISAAEVGAGAGAGGTAAADGTTITVGVPALPALMGLALTAALLEAATMLPYLAAIGMIGSAALAVPTRLVVLAGYCLVMVLPAVVLLVARLVAARRVEPLLRRLSGWLTKNAGETTAWIVGIVGVMVALDAFGRLGLSG